MKKIIIFMIIALISSIFAETLFEVKDASNNKVLDISTDGLRVMNLGDTLMVISPAAVKVNLDNSAGKALSRTFSVSTTSAKGKGLTNVLEVGTGSTLMREAAGDQYTNFSPDNLFLGLQAGANTQINYTNSWGINNVFMGNYAGVLNEIGSDNIFMGFSAGNKNIHSSDNIFIGSYAGYNTDSDDLPPYGSMNVFLGTRTGYSNLDGFDNICIGNMAGESFTGSSQNVFIGGYAGNACTTSRNTLVGSLSMYRNTTGNHNVTLGAETGYNNLSGSGNIFLGYQTGYNETGSNKLYIDNSNSSTPLIYGEFDNNMIKVNGNLTSEEITTTNDTPGVYGKHAVTDNYGIGVKGEGKWMGVQGITSNASGTGYALYGYSSGVGTGTRYGVYASASGGAAAWAGYFAGNVYVTGTVSANAYTEFKMDHPIDPENKLLTFSSVASDEMTNIINGNVLLDSEGRALVKLPEWFEAANTDYKYQLTAIGAPGPNLYISKEISNNSFEIAGGSAGMKVSWMISAVRYDNYAKANPIVNVTDKKSNEKGYYLHPEAFGRSEESGIVYQTQKKEKTDLK